MIYHESVPRTPDPHTARRYLPGDTALPPVVLNRSAGSPKDLGPAYPASCRSASAHTTQQTTVWSVGWSVAAVWSGSSTAPPGPVAIQPGLNVGAPPQPEARMVDQGIRETLAVADRYGIAARYPLAAAGRAAEKVTKLVDVNQVP